MPSEFESHLLRQNIMSKSFNQLKCIDKVSKNHRKHNGTEKSYKVMKKIQSGKIIPYENYGKDWDYILDEYGSCALDGFY